MEGPMSHVNPDNVEVEVGNFWRALYKLEKGFENAPMPKKIATKVCMKFFYNLDLCFFTISVNNVDLNTVHSAACILKAINVF